MHPRHLPLLLRLEDNEIGIAYSGVVILEIGPPCLCAAEVFTPGLEDAEVFTTGLELSEVFSPGLEDCEVECECV